MGIDEDCVGGEVGTVINATTATGRRSAGGAGGQGCTAAELLATPGPRFFVEVACLS